ncbi:MAG: YihY/virulence factor BrkB family protein [Anaerolineaceae bacterium]|nr:YihY/virulence factor BrkB family protein [Anaerolineaceae bacterium]
MKKFLINFFELIKEAFKEWKADKVSRLAAALSYYTIIALAPLVLVLLSLLGLFMRTEQAGKLFMEQALGLVGQGGSEFFEQLIQSTRNVPKTLTSNLIALGTAAFGASGLFVQLKDAINTAWGIPSERLKGFKFFVRARAHSFGAILILGIILLVSLLVSTALTALRSELGPWLGDAASVVDFLNQLISLLIFCGLFAFMFRYLPLIELKWSDVLPGAFFTAILFSLGKYAFAIYLGSTNIGGTYGAFGSLIVVLLWVFYSSQILLFGSEFTQVYASKYGSMADKPSPKKVLEGLDGETVLLACEKLKAGGYSPINADNEIK